MTVEALCKAFISISFCGSNKTWISSSPWASSGCGHKPSCFATFSITSSTSARTAASGANSGLIAFSPTLARADTDAGLAALRDSLRAWESLPPAPDTLASERSLQELFPGAEITSVGQAWRIALPPLHAGRFAPSLWAHGAGPDWTFSVDMERRDSLLALDGRVVDGLPADTALAGLHERVAATLTALRALAVPSGSAAPPQWPHRIGICPGAAV